MNWEVNLGNVPITSTLLLANGMVYVSDGVGPPGGLADLYALSQTDGHTIWSTTLDTSAYAAYASPIVFNGMVYIGVATNGSETDTSLVGKIFAVNATTGHVAWSFTTSIGNTGGAGVWGSVAIDPSLDSIYFGTSNAYGPGTNSLYSYSILSLNAKTGTLNWYYQAYSSLSSGGDLDFGSSPNLFSVVINGVTHAAVGLGAKDGKYYVLDRVTGSLLETLPIGTGNADGGIIGLAGFIYLSQNNPELFIPSYNTVVGGDYGVVKAVTPLDGSLKWQFNTPGTVQGSVVVVPRAVLFGDVSGNVFALSTSSGSQLFHTTVPGSVAEESLPQRGSCSSLCVSARGGRADSTPLVEPQWTNFSAPRRDQDQSGTWSPTFRPCLVPLDTVFRWREARSHSPSLQD